MSLPQNNGFFNDFPTFAGNCFDSSRRNASTGDQKTLADEVFGYFHIEM